MQEAKKRVGRYQRLLAPAPPSAGADTYLPYDRLVYYLDEPAVRDHYRLLPKTWEEALRLCGQDWPSLIRVATSAYDRKNFEIAEKACRSGVELGEGRAASNLGWLLEKQGKTDEAEAAYRIGVELGHAGATSNLGLLLVQQGRSDEAAESLDTAFAILGRDTPYVKVLQKLHDDIGPETYNDLLRLMTKDG